MSKLKKYKNFYAVDEVQLSTTAMLELNAGFSIDVDIKILDIRKMSQEQRRFIFALCNDVENYSGKNKSVFRVERMEIEGVESLAESSNTTITQANNIIDNIITYMLVNEIPFSRGVVQDGLFKFTKVHMYLLILNQRCCVCGAHAEIHHVDSVGMGNNRKKVSNKGKKILPLCRKHHTEAHKYGNNTFMLSYHLEPVTADERIDKFIKHGVIKWFDEDDNQQRHTKKKGQEK